MRFRPAQGEEHMVGAERRAEEAHPRDVPGDSPGHRHQIPLEPRVVQARADFEGPAGSAHVHADHVVTRREGMQAHREHVGRVIPAAHAVEQDQGGGTGAASFLPGGARQNPDVRLRVDEQVFGRKGPAETPSKDITEDGLDMTAPGKPGGDEGAEAGLSGRGRGGRWNHADSTILPKCSDASIMRCASPARSRGRTAWTCVFSRPAKK